LRYRIWRDFGIHDRKQVLELPDLLMIAKERSQLVACQSKLSRCGSLRH
jgi:hypothetical protein